MAAPVSLSQVSARIHSAKNFVWTRPMHTALRRPKRPMSVAQQRTASPRRPRLQVSIIAPIAETAPAEEPTSQQGLKVDAETEAQLPMELRRFPTIEVKMFGINLEPQGESVRRTTPVKRPPQRLSFSARRTRTPPPTHPSVSALKSDIEALTYWHSEHTHSLLPICPSLVKESPSQRYKKYLFPKKHSVKPKTVRRQDSSACEFLMVVNTASRPRHPAG